MSLLRNTTVLLVAASLLSCLRTAPDFAFWEGYDIEQLAQTPIIVVGSVQDRAIGRRVHVRGNGGDAAAREWRCRIQTEMVLRGNGIAHSTEFVGYVVELEFQIGGDRSVCPEPGVRAVFFLRQNGNVLRPITDNYAIYYRLDPLSTLPETIVSFTAAFWEVVWNSAQRSDDPARTLSDRFESIQLVLGELSTFRHLLTVLEGTSDQLARVTWCLFINDRYPGWGASDCLDELPANGNLPGATSVELKEARAKAEENVQLLKLALQSRRSDALNVYLGGYKVPRDPKEDREFLLFLTSHRDPEIRRLASEWLSH